MTRDQATKFIKEIHFGYLATVDTNNTPHVRPIGIDTIYDGVYISLPSVLHEKLLKWQ